MSGSPESPVAEKIFENKNINYKNILVFDVETSGLIPKQFNKRSPLVSYPYILQLSFILYDLETNTVLQKYNSYVRPPSNVFINSEITKITGITNEICNTKGISIVEVLSVFYQAYSRADCIIAHNLTFDKTMIDIEIQRNKAELSVIPEILFMFNPLYNRINKIQLFCTMKYCKKYCNIQILNEKTGKTYFKFPKLSELYEKMFGVIPENLHDSSVDVEACLRCFLEIKRLNL